MGKSRRLEFFVVLGAASDFWLPLLLTEDMETILIQNFKAIKNIAKQEINVANLTILMGEQATGKSTVAKLVYFFKKLPEQILFELLENKDINEKTFGVIISRRLSSFFGQLFDFSSLSSDYEIIYTYKNGLNLKINGLWQSNAIYLLWPSLQYAKTVINELMPIYNSIIMSSEWHIEDFYEKKESYSTMLSQKIGLIFGVNQYSIYIPASRNIVVSMEKHLLELFSSIEKSIALGNRSSNSESDLIIRDFIKYVQIIKNKFRRGGFNQIAQFHSSDKENSNLIDEFINRVEEILVGNYQYIDSGERIYTGDLEKYVFLENSSSGQQEAIRIIQDLFLEILEARPVFRVYEEPESHLSPIGQQGIIRLISMLANRNPDNQIIIPTHTSYMLREVTNMMTADKVVKEHPELREEVGKVLKSYYWLDLDSVSAYELTRAGEIIDAKDSEYDMIDGDLFDRVTNEISDQFDKLLKLQYAE